MATFNNFGNMLAPLTAFLAVSLLGPENMAEYGWRIPFIVGGLLGFIVLWLRRTLPETIDTELLSSGAHAVTTEEALSDVEVVILSIPLNRIPGAAPRVARLPEETVVIDTSNYYPFRDDRIEAIEAG